MLRIENLQACIEDKKILCGLDLEVGAGQVHAIMGPNGAAKSTLVKVLGGDEAYDVSEGKIFFCGENITDLEPQERAQKGLFISFQYPPEIPGIRNDEFLYQAYAAKRKSLGKEEISKEDFKKNILLAHLASLEIQKSFLERDLNDGFSGGEKKKNEILQMKILEPKLAVLDETDSGLDIDALGKIAKAIEEFRSADRSVILITHYQRLLDYVKPDIVHVMKGGRIVRSGNYELAQELERVGYSTC